MSDEQKVPAQTDEEVGEELDNFINPVGDSNLVEVDSDSLDGPKRKFVDPQYLWNKCKEYFDYCDNKQQSYTIPDLAYHLGFTSRQAIFVYLKRGDNCAKVIRAAKLCIEAQRNRQVVDGQGQMAGRIFDLKCNFGYNDQGQGEGESQQQPQINVQQNFHGLPPQPQTLEEWTQQYQRLMQGQQKSQPVEPDNEEQSVIDVSGSTKQALEEDDDG